MVLAHILVLLFDVGNYFLNLMVMLELKASLEMVALTSSETSL